MKFVTYKFYDYTPEELTTLCTQLVGLGMNVLLVDEVKTIFNNMGTNGYRTMLLNESITRTNSIPILAWNIWEYMSRYSNILTKFGDESRQLTLLDENQVEEIEYGKVEDEKLRNMNEDAPITSPPLTPTLTPDYDIDTPASRYNADNQKTNSGSDTTTKTNPYYYGEFLRLLEKYNIKRIIMDSIKYITYEYNSVN